MPDQLYLKESSEYIKNNPDWHVGDAEWKSMQVLKMLDRNKLELHRVGEIGCGAGEMLHLLHQKLSANGATFFGYEIAPDAMKLNQQRIKEGLSFYHEDLLVKNEYFDLLLMMDVLEHVEDCYGFVRKAATKATYKIYHIPLDISLLGILRNVPGAARDKVGHIHFFTKNTAIAIIKDSQQEIMDWFYTPVMIEVHNQKMSTRALNLFRKFVYRLNKDLAVTLFGGYSILVLAK